ncbi:MAG: cytochrome P450 [Polyangiaceae bacterium]
MLSEGDPFAYNPFDAAYDRDPYPTYERMRREHPVYFWPAANAFLLSRHEDVNRALLDPRMSTSFLEWDFLRPRMALIQGTSAHRLLASALLNLSPADHARIRKLTNPVFTPRSVERLRSVVQHEVDALLSGVGTGDTFDIVSGLAEPFPRRALELLLGIPRERTGELQQFGTAVSDLLFPWLSDAEFAEHIACIERNVRFFEALIEERRKAPGDDLLSALVCTEDLGEKLSLDELLAFIAALVTGGMETTIHALCFAVYDLLRHPDQAKLLRDDPSLFKNAFDETLRFNNFGKLGVLRFPTEDMEIQGVTIGKGQCVYAMLGSALRDPDAFPNPDVFDIRRDQSKNLTFGLGPRYCVGAAVARLEAQVALTTLLTRFPNMRLASEPVFQVLHPFMRKMSSLPVKVHG